VEGDRTEEDAERINDEMVKQMEQRRQANPREAAVAGGPATGR
jgi:hypothetical protein